MDMNIAWNDDIGYGNAGLGGDLADQGQISTYQGSEEYGQSNLHVRDDRPGKRLSSAYLQFQASAQMHLWHMGHLAHDEPGGSPRVPIQSKRVTTDVASRAGVAKHRHPHLPPFG